MATHHNETTFGNLTQKHKNNAIKCVAVSGATGLVGTKFVKLLTDKGLSITKIVRRQASESEVCWDPTGKAFDASPLDGTDAIVHLAGENIAAARWSKNVKQKIRDSRVHGTRILCDGLANMQAPPKVLICASAIGFYGERGDEVLTEDASAGKGFLADVAKEWEEATQPARDAGIRVVNLRFGVILSPRDGALAKMLLPFKLGIGGRIGKGNQFWSWISLTDTANAIQHAIVTDSLSGPVNVVSPNAVTNLEFTKTLGRVLNRPTVAPMPAFAARLALGEMADALLLASIRVRPQKLDDTGFEFEHCTLDSALRSMLSTNK